MEDSAIGFMDKQIERCKQANGVFVDGLCRINPKPISKRTSWLARIIFFLFFTGLIFGVAWFAVKPFLKTALASLLQQYAGLGLALTGAAVVISVIAGFWLSERVVKYA